MCSSRCRITSGLDDQAEYEPAWEAMSISRSLPLGVVYPFDWGFVPSTRASDGDPLDAIVLWDVQAYPGIVLPCRALGVLQAASRETRIAALHLHESSAIHAWHMQIDEHQVDAGVVTQKSAILRYRPQRSTTSNPAKWSKRSNTSSTVGCHPP
jgi:hypothetical protein